MVTRILSPDDLTRFETSLEQAVKGMRSIAEIENWLKAQACVVSAHVENYLLKTNPPQRQITVDLRGEGDQTLTKIISLYEYTPETFAFHTLRDA